MISISPNNRIQLNKRLCDLLGFSNQEEFMKLTITDEGLYITKGDEKNFRVYIQSSLTYKVQLSTLADYLRDYFKHDESHILHLNVSTVSTEDGHLISRRYERGS